jgi:hypothetical protein
MKGEKMEEEKNVERSQEEEIELKLLKLRFLAYGYDIVGKGTLVKFPKKIAKRLMTDDLWKGWFSDAEYPELQKQPKQGRKYE